MMNEKLPNRTLNPQIEKMQGVNKQNRCLVMWFVHRLGKCLERRVVDNGN